jgi:hypothetical protein
MIRLVNTKKLWRNNFIIKRQLRIENENLKFKQGGTSTEVKYLHDML